MKTNVLVVLFVCLFISVQAQVDVKINPIGILFGNPDVSADFALSDKFSVEGGLGLNVGNLGIDGLDYKRSGVSALLIGRTYLNPEAGADKFGIGLYTRYRNITGKAESSIDQYERNRLAVGFLFGWKWVSTNGLVFELDFGGGRAFVNDITIGDESTTNIDDIPVLNMDILVRLAVGYRFGSASR